MRSSLLEKFLTAAQNELLSCCFAGASKLGVVKIRRYDLHLQSSLTVFLPPALTQLENISLLGGRHATRPGKKKL
jgi:hypothetical protein